MANMIALQISPKIESLLDWVDRPQNYKGLYDIWTQQLTPYNLFLVSSSTAEPNEPLNM